MPRKLIGYTFAIALAVCCTGLASAQDGVLSQFYGSGVHAFFAGNYSKASQELTTAINSGSKDPRAYYFRGLANLKHGLTDEARADFQRGAALETADSNRMYPVSKSLERIQGSDRLTLERYRSLARATAVARQEKRMQARYEALRRNEADKLRRVARPRIDMAQPAAAAEAVRRAPAAAAVPKSGVPAAAPAGDDPFATDVAPAAPADTPAGSDPADPSNPFGDSAVEGAEPAGDAPAADDPFGAAGADVAPAAKPAPAPAAGDSSDPFGLDAPAEMPADAAPAKAGAKEPPADASDPFADDAAASDGGAAKGAAMKKEDAKPKAEAPDADNPFGT